MKINQIKTTTDREPSVLPISTKYAPFVWLKLIEKNITGLTYTQKKFIEFIIKADLERSHITPGTSYTMACFSAYDIIEKVWNYYKKLHNLINIKDPLQSAESISKIVGCNPKMLAPTNGTIRTQKIIRIAMAPILTERQIRKLSKQFKNYEYVVSNTPAQGNTDAWLKEHYPQAFENRISGDDNVWYRYMSKYININMLRLYKALAKGANQIVHLCDLKTYSSSRLHNISYNLKECLLMERKGQLSGYEINDIQQEASNLEWFPTLRISQTTVIAYDTYMDQYNRYSVNRSEEAPIHLRLISKSLLNDIIDAIGDIRLQPIGSIQKDKKKLKKHKIDTTIMSSYAKIMSTLPSKQSDDRHFTINSKGEMSYTPANKPTYLNANNDKWLQGADRMVTKFGKGVKKLFDKYPYKIEDFIIEQICNKLKAKHTFQGVFKVVEGEEIRKWYLGENYNESQNTMSLYASCMKHKSCQNMLDIYTTNPDNIKMLICTEEVFNGDKKVDKLIGRALIWYQKKKPLFMDRIYGNDKTIASFKDWAIDKDILYKYRQSYEEKTTFINAVGASTNMEFKIKLSIPSQCKLPYVDTMSYMKVITKNKTKGKDNIDVIELSNGTDNYEICLTNTSGIYSRYHTTHRRSTDDNEAIWNEEEEMYEIDGELYDEDDVSYCEHREQYYHNDDTVWSETDDCCYHQDLIYWVGDQAFCIENSYDCHVWSEYHDEYLWTDDAERVHDSYGDDYDYMRVDQTVYLEHRDFSIAENDAFCCDVLENRDGCGGYEHHNNSQYIILTEDSRRIEISNDVSDTDISEVFGEQETDWNYE